MEMMTRCGEEEVNLASNYRFVTVLLRTVINNASLNPEAVLISPVNPPTFCRQQTH